MCLGRSLNFVPRGDALAKGQNSKNVLGINPASWRQAATAVVWLRLKDFDDRESLRDAAADSTIAGCDRIRPRCYLRAGRPEVHRGAWCREADDVVGLLWRKT